MAFRSPLPTTPGVPPNDRRDVRAGRASLSAEERRHIVDTAVEILRDRRRDRLLGVLADRITAGDYPSAREHGLDEVAYAIGEAIAAELAEPER